MSIHSLACELVQLFARLTETDDNGYGYCCTCGKLLSWGDGDGGHCIPKGNTCNQASIDTRNVHLQCRVCNSSPEIATSPVQFLSGVVLAAAGVQAENQSWGNVESFKVADRFKAYIEKTYNPGTYEELCLAGKVPLDRDAAHLIVESFRRICRKMAKKKSFKVNIP